MKKLLSKLEEKEYSTREYLLLLVTFFVTGLLLGIIFSPKGERTIGSNNGNNNSGSFATPKDECCDTDDGK